METSVAFEASEFVEELSNRFESKANEKDLDGLEKQEGPTWLTLCPHTMFERNTLNVIWQLVTSSRFDSGDDPAFQKLMTLMHRANRTFTAPNTILEVLPFFRHIPHLTFLGAWWDCSNFYYNVFKVQKNDSTL